MAKIFQVDNCKNWCCKSLYLSRDIIIFDEVTSSLDKILMKK